MARENVSEVHPVKLIAGKDDEVLVVGVQEVPEILPNCISGTLIPALSAGGLLGREYFYECFGEMVELVSGVNVTME